jgi:HEAT repeat protein
MKRFFVLLSLLALALPHRPASAAGAGEQEQLIAILRSDRSLQEKDQACSRLKWMGDARCVPALATLLTDDQLSHSARYALESMPLPEAETALLQALPKTSGSNQVSIVNSLAVRRDAAAVPALAPLLSGTDTRVAAAAAMALGRIGGPKALEALQTAWSDTDTGAVHLAETDGLLACANQLLTEGKDSAALKTFRRLYDSAKTDGVRQAAFCGVILASGRHGVALMSQAIVGNDSASQGAALQVAATLKGAGVTKALADLLPIVPAPVDLALLQCLDQRDDPSAAMDVNRMMGRSDPDVRLAAITVFGDLGVGTAAAILLATTAASATGAERNAARQALVNVRHGDFSHPLLNYLAEIEPASVQVELIRALGTRGDIAAVPKLLEIARSQNDSTRASSLQALALLAGPAQLPGLVQLTVQAPDDTARSEVADALNSACQRIESRTGHCDTAALAKAARSGPLEARLALLPVCAGLTQAPSRAALRAAVEDPDAHVRQAALRALCDTRDGELLPDLLKVARGASDKKLRLLAVRGCVRLATREEGVRLSAAQKLAVLTNILDGSPDAAEKRLLLSGLGAIAAPEALATATAMLDDDAVRTEAAQAVIQIAAALAGAEPDAAGAALKKVLALATDAATRDAAQAALTEVLKWSGFITRWEVAGPYLEKDKDYMALFDIAFPPETSRSAAVHWRELPVNPDRSQAWQMDLLQALGGEQRVAYARTWLFAPKTQKARLEIGSDDGVKVWLDGRLVHANNVARALQPGSDNVEVTLNQGWSPLMLKVTQNNAGWGFCVRVTQPDGAPVAGLRASPVPEAARR